MYFSIRTLLVIGFSLMALLVGMMGGAGYLAMKQASRNVSALVNEDAGLVNQNAQKIKVLMLQHRRYEKDIFLNIGNRNTQQDKYLPQIAEKAVVVRKLIRANTEMIKNNVRFPEEIRIKAGKLPDLYEAYHAGLMAVVNRAINEDGLSPQVANKAMASYKEAIHDLEESIDEVAAAAAEVLVETKVGAQKSASNWLRIMVWLIPVGLFLAVIAASIIIRAVVMPLNAGVESLMKVANEGDISEDVDKELAGRGDEIGRLFQAIQAIIDAQRAEIGAAEGMADGNWDLEVPERSGKDLLSQAINKMIEAVNRAIGGVRETAVQVNAGAAQISDASQSLSQGTTEQAASLEEISSSMNEIAAQTKANAENASQADQLSKTAQVSGQKGTEQMQEMMAAMGNISESSNDIKKVIKTIDDIAFQTNLLALNAAVEAARAGKHGKGFAVVAQEVRSLAARSAKAARETSDMLDGAIKNVENGSELAMETAEGLADIVEGIAKVSDLVAEIAAASNEQAQGVSQIHQGVSQLDGVTQQNTASAEETASAAAELSSQADYVRELLAQFTLRRKEDNFSPVAPRGNDLPAFVLEQSSTPSPEQNNTWGD